MDYNKHRDSDASIQPLSGANYHAAPTNPDYAYQDQPYQKQGTSKWVSSCDDAERIASGLHCIRSSLKSAYQSPLWSSSLQSSEAS